MNTHEKATKAKTAGQRKRIKRNRQKISLAKGDTANSRPTGRDRRHTNQPAEDARTTVFEARVRVNGLNTKKHETEVAKKHAAYAKANPDAMKDAGWVIGAVEEAAAARKKDAQDAIERAKSPLCTDAVDRCIMALAKDQAAVAQTWRAIITAQHNYRTRILGQTGYPKGAAIAMVPDRMEADNGHTIDIRTADEKDAAAKRAWASWETAIKALPVPQWIWAIRNALTGGMDGAGGDVWRDGQPTARGRVLVDALVAVGG